MAFKLIKESVNTAMIAVGVVYDKTKLLEECNRSLSESLRIFLKGLCWISLLRTQTFLFVTTWGGTRDKPRRLVLDKSYISDMGCQVTLAEIK